LIRPTLALAVAINRAARDAGEWFNEPGVLERVEQALGSIDGIDDPVRAAGVLAFASLGPKGWPKATSAPGSSWPDGCWTATASTAPPCSRRNDRDLAELLIKAAAGTDVERQIVALIVRRAYTSRARSGRSGAAGVPDRHLYG
jgi:hypothetical protein